MSSGHNSSARGQRSQSDGVQKRNTGQFDDFDMVEDHVDLPHQFPPLKPTPSTQSDECLDLEGMEDPFG